MVELLLSTCLFINLLIQKFKHIENYLLVKYRYLNIYSNAFFNKHFQNNSMVLNYFTSKATYKYYILTNLKSF
jgi:hypothetical protein